MSIGNSRGATDHWDRLARALRRPFANREMRFAVAHRPGLIFSAGVYEKLVEAVGFGRQHGALRARLGGCQKGKPQAQISISEFDLVGRASTPVDVGLRPTDSDENRCKALGGGLEPARGFIPAGDLPGRRLIFNRLQWVFDRAAGFQTRQ